MLTFTLWGSIVGFAEPVLDGSNRVSAIKIPTAVLRRLFKDENPIRQLSIGKLTTPPSCLPHSNSAIGCDSSTPSTRKGDQFNASPTRVRLVD